MKITNTISAAFIILLSVTSVGHASMPALTEEPTKKTADTCFAWAKQQDEDAHYMWGMNADGSADSELGILRLAINCKTGEKPETVGLGSSFGYDKGYCTKYPKAGYCRKNRH